MKPIYYLALKIYWHLFGELGLFHTEENVDLSKDDIEIEILDWDKFNPRKDLKSMSWLRIEATIAINEKLFDLSPAGKWFWVYILSFSAMKMRGRNKFRLEYFGMQSGLSKKEIEATVKILVRENLIKISSSDRKKDTNELVTNTIENVPNEHNEHNEHNERDEHNTTKKIDRTSYDFESVYFIYPKKEGKKKGLEKLKATIKTKEDFDKLILCTKNYSEKVRLENTELKYIKQFSTFANCYTDYEEIQIQTQGQSPAMQKQSAMLALRDQYAKEIGEQNDNSYY